MMKTMIMTTRTDDVISDIRKKRIPVFPVYNIKACSEKGGITPLIPHHGNIQGERLTSYCCTLSK